MRTMEAPGRGKGPRGLDQAQVSSVYSGRSWESPDLLFIVMMFTREPLKPEYGARGSLCSVVDSDAGVKPGTVNKGNWGSRAGLETMPTQPAPNMSTLTLFDAERAASQESLGRAALGWDSWAETVASMPEIQRQAGGARPGWLALEVQSCAGARRNAQWFWEWRARRSVTQSPFTTRPAAQWAVRAAHSPELPRAPPPRLRAACCGPRLTRSSPQVATVKQDGSGAL